METLHPIPAAPDPRSAFGPAPGTKARRAGVRRERAADVWPHTQIALPDWDDLRLLLSVVGEGSLGRSAKALGLTQPTMSRRIRRLEHELGTALLTRSSRGVTLTLQAQLIVAELKAAQAAIERALGRTAATGAPRQSFTLATTPNLAVHWLPRFAGAFIAQHKHIDLNILATDDANRGETAQHEIAVHDVAPGEPNLVTARLGTIHAVPYASRAYVERHGLPDTAGALAEHCLLDCAQHLTDCGSWTARLSNSDAALRARYFTNSAASLSEAVLAGAGIALLPTFAAVFEPDLVPLEIGIRFARPFWLSYRRELALKSAAAQVLPFLKQAFNRRTMPWFSDSYLGGRFDGAPAARMG